jgi:Ras-related protein Rab-5C
LANKIRTKGNPNVKLFLIGNKIDLKEKRKVTEEQANKFHIDYGFYLFLEASAKTGFNIQKIFVGCSYFI